MKGPSRWSWLPTRREIAVVVVAALLGGLLGWITRPDRSIRRATREEIEAVERDRGTSTTSAPAPATRAASPSSLPPARSSATERSQPATATSAATRKARIVRAQPVRVTMAVLGVFDAEVVAVGVAADGSLEVPGGEQAGWYRYGARPGDPGNVVLAAHVAYSGQPGVFARLAELSSGDSVRLTDAEGGYSEWTVTGVGATAKTQLPVEDLFRTDGPPMLVLITCGGAIDPVRGTYDGNVVVVAQPVAL